MAERHIYAATDQAECYQRNQAKGRRGAQGICGCIGVWASRGEKQHLRNSTKAWRRRQQDRAEDRQRPEQRA
jgi:hypothetical protein